MSLFKKTKTPTEARDWGSRFQPRSPLSWPEFLKILELATSATVAVEDGEMILVNSEFETLFGYSWQDLSGQKIEMLIPREYAQKHVVKRKNYQNNPHIRLMGGTDALLYGQHKDGSIFPVMVGLEPVEVDGRDLVIATVRDLSGEKSMGEELSILEHTFALHNKELE